MKDEKESYFGWIERNTRRVRPEVRSRRLVDELDCESPARPSEPIAVQEHQADTTVIHRLRRFWFDKR